MASRDPNRPNIVFILSDDQGPWAVGYAGNDEIITPNLDALAESGVRFSNCFCTSPVCSPARASILTGTIPSSHGVHDWLDEGEKGITYLQGQKSLTDHLSEAGYICGISGKWHLGNSIIPQHGFTHWYVHQKGGGDYNRAPMIRNGKPVIESGYITDLITNDALSFIEEQLESEQPFYASVHYTAPHAPWIDQHPVEYTSLYDKCPFASCKQAPKHPWARFSSDPNATPESVLEDPIEHLKGYYGAITAMDANIGQIVDYLEKQNLLESTLIVFMSDNGFSCGQYGFWGKGNGTYPLNLFEHSIKVPALMSQRGRIAPNVASDALVSGYDILPTLLSYVGIPYKDLAKPGRDLTFLLENGRKEEADEQPIVIFSEYGGVRMIRTKAWKYIHRYDCDINELYHLAEDPEEQHNLAQDPTTKSKQRELLAEMESWFATYHRDERDGKNLPVTGGGQTNLSEKHSPTQSAFNPFV